MKPPASGSLRSLQAFGLGLPAPIPPPPIAEMERVLGRLHLTTYCQREAKREMDAFLRGEEYAFLTPETDAGGYLVGWLSGRPPVPVRRDPPPIKS